jgi:hypothetical protein
MSEEIEIAGVKISQSDWEKTPKSVPELLPFWIIRTQIAILLEV